MATTQSTFDGQGIQITGSGSVQVNGNISIGTQVYDGILADLMLTNPEDDKKRIEATKGGLLKDSYRWILTHHDFLHWRENPDSRLLWIKGDPGKGKTMLLCGIINELETISPGIPKSGPAYFFCQATDDRLNGATGVLRGLLYVLVRQHPHLITYIQERYKHAGKSTFEGVNAWIVLSGILARMLGDAALEAKIFVIDALDECITDLELLLEFISTTCRGKWIVSSRNWTNIEEAFDFATSKTRVSLELNADSVAAAVRTYIHHKVAQLVRLKHWDDATRDNIQGHLISNSNDTFLWVALVFQQLAKLHVKKRHTDSILKTNFPLGLTALYRRMMDHIEDSLDAELCKEVLAIISLVYRPLTTLELMTLLRSSSQINDDITCLEEIIASCGSFLTLRNATVYFIHQSAKDFVLEQAANRILPLGTARQHRAISEACLDVLYENLRRDIYDVDDPGCKIEDICTPREDPLASLVYSCIHWVDHVQESLTTENLADDGLVHNFLRGKYLYWLEAMSLLKSMSPAVRAIRKLKHLVPNTAEAENLRDLSHDAYRFTLYHRPTIERFPLQIYASALVFTPRDSLIRGLFQEGENHWIMRNPRMKARWNSCLQILPIPADLVVASPNRAQIALCAFSSIFVWDAETGARMQRLRGPGNYKSIATLFSPDGKQICSGFRNGTVLEWDVQTGRLLQEFKLEEGMEMAFAPDGRYIASIASDCKTLRIWDRSLSHQHCRAFRVEGEEFWRLSFAPDCRHVAAGSEAGATWIWDAATGSLLGMPLRQDSRVDALAFSPDSKQIVSGTHDGEIALWEVASAVRLHTLVGHQSKVRSFSYSRDGKLLASGSYDMTIRIWNPSTGVCVEALRANNGVSSITFLPDGQQLVSSTFSGEVAVWEVGSLSNNRELESHEKEVKVIAVSPDGTLAISGDQGGIAMMWEVTTGKYLRKFKASSAISAIAFSSDTRLLAVGDMTGTVFIWEALATGKCLQMIDCCNYSLVYLVSISFSADGKQVVLSFNTDREISPIEGSASASKGYWEVWPIGRWHILSKGHSTEQIQSAAFSPDGKHIASGSREGTIRIWDIATSTCLRVFGGKPRDSPTKNVIFSPDAKNVATTQDDEVLVWEVETGNLLFSTKGYFRRLTFWGEQGLHADLGTVFPKGESSDGKLAGNVTRLDGRWILRGGKRVLRLPTEYCPVTEDMTAASRNTLVWGCTSGRVLFLSFSTICSDGETHHQQ